MKLFNISVSLHWSVIVLLYMITASAHGLISAACQSSNSELVLLLSLSAGILVLASIVAHELGHALVGRKFGIETNSIVLHAIGGVANMKSGPPTAKSEFWMALAGPLVSVALFLVFFASGSYISYSFGDSVYLRTIGYISITNLVLAVFNMLPAFPMDGGRVLRAIIWHFCKSLSRATFWAAGIGTVCSVAMMLAGILMGLGVGLPGLGSGLSSGIWMIIVGFFIYMACKSETNYVNNKG